MAARLWEPHLEGSVHTLSVIRGTWEKAVALHRKYVDLRTNGDTSIRSVRLGWFEMTLPKGVDYALVLVEHSDGQLTTFLTDETFKIHPKMLKYRCLSSDYEPEI